jgi:ABC-type branched-subunit amino acid transport system permease subunit
LGAAILVEIPIALVLLSRILKNRANRWANIIAGTFLTAVQFVSLFVGTPTLAYAFLSIILIATTAVIVWYAWRWPNIEGNYTGVQAIDRGSPAKKAASAASMD